MRFALDLLYRVCAVLAALFLAAIAVLILAQTIGRQFGIVVPSANELAGFAMAATSFLALAPTFRAGGHIRVGMLLNGLPAGARRAAELWCLAFGLITVGYFAWASLGLIRGSIRFHEVSPGLLPVPLWLPQTAMALGLIVLEIALLEAFILVVRGRAAPYQAAPGEVASAAERETRG